MIRRTTRSTQGRSSAASDVYKRQLVLLPIDRLHYGRTHEKREEKNRALFGRFPDRGDTDRVVPTPGFVRLREVSSRFPVEDRARPSGLHGVRHRSSPLYRMD